MKKNSELKKLRILLIDDNERITKMFTIFLTLKNLECVVANEGKEGLKLILSQNFDIVLLDLAIPEFDGYDIINELEKNDKIKDNKIILFTASNISQKKLKELFERGVHSYIAKPADIDEVFTKIIQAAQT